jgi:hypothetical protein
MSLPTKGIRQAFKPLAELDEYLNVEIRLLKYRTVHWHSDSGTDFVTLDANQVCRFQLGEFASEGKVAYPGNFGGLGMKFEHKGRDHFVTFRGEASDTRLRRAGLAHAAVILTDPVEKTVRGIWSPASPYHTTLTKQSPSAPAP